MAASNSDMFTEVGSPGSATSLASPGHTVAGTSITVGSTSNWPTSTGVIFAIDTVSLVNGVETRDAGSYTEWEGVVTSGTTMDNLVLRYGTDQNYPAGSTTRVYIPVASSRENRLAQGVSVSLNQDGTLKVGAVSIAAILANDVVTTAKIADGNVTNAKLATSTGEIGAPWNNWTPTYTNATNITTQYAKYVQIGKTVHFRIQFNLGVSSVISGIMGFSLPLTANSDLADANDFPLCSGQLSDATGNRWNPAVAFGSTTRLDIYYWNTAANIANTSSSAPFTWANNDLIAISGTYDAA